MKDINFLMSDKAVPAQNLAGEQQKKVPAAQIIIFVISFTIAVLILFIPGIIIAGIDKQVSTVEKSMFDPKYSQLRNTKAEMINITQVVDGKKSVIRDIDRKNTPASQILVLVQQAVPADCYISSINYSGSSISLSGTAANTMAYTELVGNLNRLQQIQGSVSALSMQQSFDPVDFNLQYNILK